MRKFLLFFSLAAFLFCPARAQVADSISVTGQSIVNAPDVRLQSNSIAFTPDTLRAIKTDPRYSGLKTLEALLRQRQAEEDAALKSRPPSWLFAFLLSPGTRLIFFILVACFILFLVIKFVSGRRPLFSRSKKSKSAVQQIEDSPSEHVDFRSLIRAAEMKSDFGSAVRFQFLQTLSVLQSRGAIRFSKEKTNAEYAKELPASLRAGFAKLAMAFAFVKYGDRKISGDLYSELRRNFEEFNNVDL